VLAAALFLPLCSCAAYWKDHGELVPTDADFPNLVYIKVPKTASSTTGGIVRRVGAKRGLHQARHGWEFEIPNRAYWIHNEPGVWANHANRTWVERHVATLRKPSFKLTMLRDPADRCLSYFIHVRSERYGYENTPENRLRALKNDNACANYQLQYIAPPGFDVEHATPASIAKMLSESYDFVGLDSYFDESAVILSDKLGVGLNDVLYQSAKRSDEGMIDPATGKPLPRHLSMDEEDPLVRDYVASDEWRQRNAGDYALLELVAKSINDSLAGSADLRAKLAHFHKMIAKAKEDCANDSRMERCYWHDNGCGYECLDEIEPGA